MLRSRAAAAVNPGKFVMLVLLSFQQRGLQNLRQVRHHGSLGSSAQNESQAEQQGAAGTTPAADSAACRAAHGWPVPESSAPSALKPGILMKLLLVCRSCARSRSTMGGNTLARACAVGVAAQAFAEWIALASGFAVCSRGALEPSRRPDPRRRAGNPARGPRPARRPAQGGFRIKTRHPHQASPFVRPGTGPFQLPCIESFQGSIGPGIRGHSSQARQQWSQAGWSQPVASHVHEQ